MKGNNYVGYFVAIAKYGHPLKIWSDFACEHSLVQENMENVRQEVLKPFLSSCFVHNQHIEIFGSICGPIVHGTTSIC